MIEISKLGNGCSIFDTEDSRIDFSIFTDGQSPKSSYKTMVFWDIFKDKINKAFEDYSNDICPNCGRPFISYVYRPTCNNCLEKELLRNKSYENKFKSCDYPFPDLPAPSRPLYSKGYSDWHILSEKSIGLRMNKIIFDFLGHPIDRKFNWFFKYSDINTGESRTVNLRYSGTVYKAELSFGAIIWEEKLGKIVKEMFLELYNSFDNFPGTDKRDLPIMVFEYIEEGIYEITIQLPAIPSIEENLVRRFGLNPFKFREQMNNDNSSTERERLERLERLKNAPKRPSVFIEYTQQFRRNNDVKIETLERAKGICEWCGEPAPFIKASDGTPYLEVHHIIALSEEGEDTVDNTIALCPNCHRKAHYG